MHRLPTIQVSCFLALLFFMSPTLCIAENEAETQAEAAKPVESTKEDSLNRIQETIDRIRGEIKDYQKELRSPQGKGREAQITIEIGELGSKLDSLQAAFSEIAAGEDVELLTKKDADSFSWSNELRDLLLPLFNEVKRLSSRPREIDSYRRRIDQTTEAIASLNKGIEQIKQLDHTKMSKAARRSLSALEGQWQERKQQQETELKIYQQKLDKRNAEQEGLIESASTIFDVFFRSRVRNLLIAFLVTVLVWLLLRRLHHAIQRIPRVRRAKKSFKFRLFNVLFLFFTGFGTLAVFMLALFLLNDWILVTLGVMFLLGVAWSSKQALLQFWSQAAVMLNMGPVREGERLLYNGVPYSVKSLNFYSILVNPLLDGGMLRLPIYDMPTLRSRPSNEAELWFPTKKGDWVLVGEDVFGQVLSQSPEQVVLKLVGGTHKVYQTANFVSADPAVLSQGFRHNITFGVDYQHQPKVTEDIPQTIQTFIENGFRAQGHEHLPQRLRVEFSEAGASSLDLAILADFTGDAAPQFQVLKRLLQRLAVDACNEHGWIIPFAQMTMHVASLPNDSKE